MAELTDEQVMAWYDRQLRPLHIRQLWRDWWRMVRLIHRGPSELYHCEAIETADRLFRKSAGYHLAMEAWCNREFRQPRRYSICDLPKFMLEHRMRKVGMRKPVALEAK